MFTKHKPLSFALFTHADKQSPRELCHLDYISQFAENLHNIARSQTTTANVLSRLDINSLYATEDINLEQLTSDKNFEKWRCGVILSHCRRDNNPDYSWNNTVWNLLGLSPTPRAGKPST